jgi:hypothetical protein
MNLAPTLPALRAAMTACEQTHGLNMLQHGRAVHEAYKVLVHQLETGTCPNTVLSQVYARWSWPPLASLERYHVYHDCGKHLVQTVDDQGRRQFPGHAAASARQYAHLFPEDVSTIHLIAHDMDFHVLRGEALEKLCQDPLAPILYLTAWAEVHANAEMFGGPQTDSFKIKAKRLIQAGKKLLALSPVSVPPTPTHVATGERHARL